MLSITFRFLCVLWTLFICAICEKIKSYSITAFSHRWHRGTERTDFIFAHWNAQRPKGRRTHRFIVDELWVNKLTSCLSTCWPVHSKTRHKNRSSVTLSFIYPVSMQLTNSSTRPLKTCSSVTLSFIYPVSMQLTNSSTCPLKTCSLVTLSFISPVSMQLTNSSTRPLKTCSLVTLSFIYPVYMQLVHLSTR